MRQDYRRSIGAGMASCRAARFISAMMVGRALRPAAIVATDGIEPKLQQPLCGVDPVAVENIWRHSELASWLSLIMGRRLPRAALVFFDLTGAISRCRWTHAFSR